MANTRTSLSLMDAGVPIKEPVAELQCINQRR